MIIFQIFHEMIKMSILVEFKKLTVVIWCRLKQFKVELSVIFIHSKLSVKITTGYRKKFFACSQ